jgi:hypothetical protein
VLVTALGKSLDQRPFKMSMQCQPSKPTLFYAVLTIFDTSSRRLRLIEYTGLGYQNAGDVGLVEKKALDGYPSDPRIGS